MSEQMLAQIGLTNEDANRRLCGFLNKRLGLKDEEPYDDNFRYYECVFDEYYLVKRVQVNLEDDDDIKPFHLSLDSMALITAVMTRDEKWRYAWMVAGDRPGQPMKALDESMLVAAVLADAPTCAIAAILALNLGEGETT